MAINERLDRFTLEVRERFVQHDRRFDQTDARLAENNRHLEEMKDGVGGLQVHFDRFAVDFGTVQLEHGQRIEALERARKRLPPRS
jgi:hypothetical protein